MSFDGFKDMLDDDIPDEVLDDPRWSHKLLPDMTKLTDGRFLRNIEFDDLIGEDDYISGDEE